MMTEQPSEPELTYAAALRLHQARFACHLCSRPSSRPATRVVPRPAVGPDTPGTFDAVDDWELPGDLVLCSVCTTWICQEHLFAGPGYSRVCTPCADKGHRPVRLG